MKVILVPFLMFLSSALMALAWLGHLRFRDQIGFSGGVGRKLASGAAGVCDERGRHPVWV